MLFFLFEEHFMWSRLNRDGGTTSYYWYDEITWAVAVIALAWFTWFLVRRYRRARALRRPPRLGNYRSLKRLVRLKGQLSSQYLRLGFSANIHAVGIGLLQGSRDYCIQVFVNDAGAELSPGSGAATLPDQYFGVPLVLIEMPPATFLAEVISTSRFAAGAYPNGIRAPQQIIVGGISGANANLSGQSGTIGYFCTRKSKLPRRPAVHLLSNAHVLACLRKGNIDDTDLIMQPSPGEPGSNRPIATLVNFCALKFGTADDPNHVDAAIARLWDVNHKPVIPMIGAIKGFVRKQDIELGEGVRKFGRTTGYTEGTVFSMYLDIWIRYDRTGESAFFQNQMLIEPVLPDFAKFVAKGDSGSLLVDAEQRAVGLIFGGMSELAGAPPGISRNTPSAKIATPGDKTQRIESYGVANPISDVLDQLKIDLLV